MSVSLALPYDGRRCVNTPLSLHACRIEGIDPWDLTTADRPSGRSARSPRRPLHSLDDADGGEEFGGSYALPDVATPGASARSARSVRGAKEAIDTELTTQLLRSYEASATAMRNVNPRSKVEADAKARFLAKRREALVATVQRRYNALAAAGGMTAVEAAIGTQRLDSPRRTVDGRAGTSYGVGGIGRITGPHPDAAAQREVSKYYARLQEDTVHAWRARADIEAKDVALLERRELTASARGVLQSERGASRDAHMARVQRDAEEQHTRRVADLMTRIAAEDERLAKWGESRRDGWRTTLLRNTTRGESQRAESVRITDARQRALSAKADEAAARAHEAATRNSAVAAATEFEHELHTAHTADTSERAMRAALYRRSLLQQKLVVERERHRLYKEGKQRQLAETLERRDAVKRVKDDITTFFRTLPKHPGDALAATAPGSPRSTRSIGGAAIRLRRPNSPLEETTGLGTRGSSTARRPRPPQQVPSIVPPEWLQKSLTDLAATQERRSDEAAQAHAARQLTASSRYARVGGRGLPETAVRHIAPFTLASRDVSPRQAFPRWMYQED
jgi:hypothetical protein